MFGLGVYKTFSGRKMFVWLGAGIMPRGSTRSTIRVLDVRRVVFAVTEIQVRRARPIIVLVPR